MKARLGVMKTLHDILKLFSYLLQLCSSDFECMGENRFQAISLVLIPVVESVLKSRNALIAAF